MSDAKSIEPFENFRRGLQPGSSLEWLKGSSRQFWENQDRVIECMESLAKGWFNRRHEGTHAAQTAVVAICSADTPLDAIRGYQEWASRAFERLADDAVAFQQAASVASAAMLEPVGAPMRIENRPETAATHAA